MPPEIRMVNGKKISTIIQELSIEISKKNDRDRYDVEIIIAHFLLDNGLTFKAIEEEVDA